MKLTTAVKAVTQSNPQEGTPSRPPKTHVKKLAGFRPSGSAEALHCPHRSTTMKKVLIGTTLLVAAGLLAQPALL